MIMHASSVQPALWTIMAMLYMAARSMDIMAMLQCSLLYDTDVYNTDKAQPV